MNSPLARLAARLSNYYRPSLTLALLLVFAGALVAVHRSGNTEQPLQERSAKAVAPRSSEKVHPTGTSAYESLRAAVRGSFNSGEAADQLMYGNRIASSVSRSTSFPQVVEMTIGDDAEQSRQTSPLLRSTQITYSSAIANSSGRDSDRERSLEQDAGLPRGGDSVTSQTPDRTIDHRPREERLVKAHEYKGDLRQLPRSRPPQRERRELEPPDITPGFYVPPGGVSPQIQTPEVQPGPTINPQANAPAPPPSNVFEGLDRFNWGAGSPPDTNGDVGPNYFIQTVNTSIGIFRKSDGFMEAGFTFNTFMSQGAFGNLCDTNNFGDPVVVYDTFEDRWIITDFAFLTDISGNVLAPAYQCIAASQSGDPLTGGWNFYSRQISDNLNDYPKFGIWPDGLYMSANMFSFGAGSTFKNARVWAFNKAQMYAGSPTVKVVSFDVGGGDFTVLPSNARLQTGTPPPGRPNLFLSTELFLNALTVYKFHVDWNSIGLSTFTGPDVPLAATSWPNANVANVPQSGTSQLLDALQIRAMVQNQYTNFGGTESLWVPHTVRRANTTGFAAPRWYQVNVTGGTVAASLPQATTWDPDGANVMHRWMPSLALDRAGNLAMGYSTSSTSTFPSIKYAGRLASDPVNTFSQTEQTFFTGTASQLSSTRWGDYSAMTLDPDGCTFWITNEYATGLDNTTIDPTSFNKRWKTKFGNIPAFPGCTPVGAGGTVSGTVTVNPGGAPISGATVMLGARSTTTDGSGNYSFTSIPAGTYPSMDASAPGFVSASASSIVVTDGNITTQNFSLTDAADSACLTDTTLSDFFTGVPTNVDLNVSPGNVTLANPSPVDQQNTTVSSSGAAFSNTAWFGQTFTPSVTGTATKVDIDLFCFSCTGSPPNLVVSIRNASGNLPAGADLASGTAAFSTSGAGGFFSVSMSSPPMLTAGTQYAIVVRMAASYATGTPAFLVSTTANPYAGGQLVNSTDSGATWGVGTVSAVNLTNRDSGFKVYMNQGFAPSGNLVSSPKDANPAPGVTPIWSTLSWNDSTPANTSLQFQVAGSNNVNGPFNFVGPDGTAGTFFTASPVNLQPQFYNFRYLEYKAYLATTDSTVTPTLNDVTVCTNDVDCSSTVATITPTPASVCANSVGNTASGPAGMTSYAWGITNGTITSATNTQTISYTAGASGAVTLNLTVTAPNGCMVSGSQPVTINPLPAKPSISGSLVFCPGGSTTLTSSAPAGNQWYVGGNPIGGATAQQYVASVAGNYTVQVIDPNGCGSPMSDVAAVTQNTPPPTPTISADTNATGTQDQACPEQPLTLHANGASGATSYQWYQDNNLINGATSSTYQATGAGTYYVTATNGTCGTPQSAGYVVQNPTPHSPFISFRNQDSSVTTLHICQGSSQIIDSDSATGIHWWRDGVDLGPGSQSLTATESLPGTHTYTAQLNALGCHSQFGRTVTIIFDSLPPTPTISGDTNGTGTQDQACPEQPLTMHANGATGATSYTWFSDNAVIPNENTSTLVMTGVGNISVTATNGTCTTPHSATYVVQNPTPHSPFISFRNQNSSVTSITFCQGSSQIIDSDSATGIQWYKDGVAIPGANSQSYTATQSGVYTAQLDALGCHSQFGRNVTVTVNPLPPTPTVNAGGPTTFCAGGSVTLTSSSASGNQWLLNGNPIGGATNQTYNATATGNYTVQVTDGNSCSSTSVPTSVTVNPVPATPTISPNGPITVSPGNSVTLTSSSASGNQWYLNGSPIGGATNQTFDANTTGSYTVVVTASGCSSPSSAATIVNVCLTSETVTNTNDSGAGSLRRAIQDVCDGGSITFDPSVTAGGPALITLTSGEFLISKSLSIQGPGANLLTLSGNNATRIFNIGSGTVTLSGLTISQGLAGPSASPANIGGGIYNHGSLTLTGCVVSGNSAASGGGLFNDTGGSLNASNSTITGNTAAGLGGGLLNQNANANLTNTTISGNTAGANGDGGGIENHASSGGTAVLTLTNCTITANTAKRGSAVFTADLLNNATNAETIIGNTLVAGNNGPNFFVSGTNGKLTDQGYNLDSDGSSGFTNGANGDQAGTSGAPINALLTPLANHGGPTQTHVLLPGSPAINGGNPAFSPPPANDQRGLSRVAGGRIDIGSVEVNYVINATAGTPQSIPINTAFPTQTQATVTESGNPISGVTVTFTAPGSGAGGTFTGNVATANVITNGNGVATAPVFTANGIAGGPYNVVASLGGNLGSVNFALTNSKGDQTITFGPITNKTFGDADFSVSASASSGLPVSLGAAGNCTVSSPSPGLVHITGAGSCTITASQAGDSNYNPAPAVPRSFTIATAVTATSVTSSVNPSDLNQSVTFTATVTSSGGTPTGTAQFKDNGTNMGPAIVLNSGGTAQFTTSSLTGGTHVITVDFTGSANFGGSTGTLAGGQVVRSQPLLSINDVSVTEGDSGTQTMNFTVTLSAASNLAVTVNFATADATANAPSDYVATAGTLTFNPGETSKPIGVTINGDVNFEVDETFAMTLSSAVNAGIAKAIGIGTIINDDPLGGVISLSQVNYSVTEATGFITLTINRSKDARNPVTVDYATDDTGAPLNCGMLNSGLASARCDFTPMFGTMQFAANETQKTIDIPINRDAFAEGPEVFKFILSNPTGGAVLGLTPSSMVTITDSAVPGANAIDDSDLFVRQQYHDFLNREPDAPGLAFWIDNINKCNDPLRLPPGQTVAQCIETQRIITSAAFFLAIEFRQTGGLVRDFYVAALNRPATGNMPNFVEFTRDTQAAQRGVVVGQGNWQTQLAVNRVAFMNEFVMRGEFVGLYPTTDTPAQYVDKLYQHANVTPGSAQERSDAIAEFGGAGTAADPGARGRALLRITQNAAFQARELNRGFVHMQYLGYLRRNPNDPPDNNFNGYDFWVNKLNQFNGDFLQAEMVKAFLASTEYRNRFGQ